jgi:hypothetical protein
VPEPRGISVKFVGGPNSGAVEFFYGQLQRLVFRKGGAYGLQYNGAASYKFIPQDQSDVHRAWSALMRTLGREVPRAIHRGAAARRRARRLLR